MAKPTHPCVLRARSPGGAMREAPAAKGEVREAEAALLWVAPLPVQPPRGRSSSPSREVLNTGLEPQGCRSPSAVSRGWYLGAVPSLGAGQRPRRGLRAAPGHSGTGRAVRCPPIPARLRGSSSPPRCPRAGSRRCPRQEQPGPGGGAAGGAVPEPRGARGRVRCLRPAP